MWTKYPIEVDGGPAAVAVDALGRLWYGDGDGVYRYESSAWQPVNLEHGVLDMVPVADGMLFVQKSDDAERVLIIRPDGRQDIETVDTLVAKEFRRVRTPSHRSRLWTVAPDGAVWYVRQGRIERYDGSQLTAYQLPYDVEGPLEIDEENVVWVAGRGQLWRLAPMPDFGLNDQFWLVAAGSRNQRSVTVYDYHGYPGSVLLTLVGLPEGVMATFESNPVPVGEATRLMLTVGASVALDRYHGTVSATDGTFTRTVPFTLAVVPVVYEIYESLLAKDRE